jgi:hypothetical protein
VFDTPRVLVPRIIEYVSYDEKCAVELCSTATQPQGSLPWGFVV